MIRSDKRSAFTLIELLVVISIIALLLSILMPSLGKVRKQAKKTVCLANMHQWGLIVNLYANDNDDKFVPPISAGYDKYWMSALREYYNNPKIRVCPSARGFQYYEDGTPNPAVMSSVANYGPFYRASGTYWAEDGDYGSYAVNGYAHDTDLPNQWRNLNQKNSNNIPVFIDSWWVTVYPLAYEVPPPWYPFKWNDMDVLGSSMARICIDRHMQTVGCLFMDASSRSVDLKELWTLKWAPDFNTRGPWTEEGGVQPGDWPEWMR